MFYRRVHNLIEMQVVKAGIRSVSALQHVGCGSKRFFSWCKEIYIGMVGVCGS